MAAPVTGSLWLTLQDANAAGILGSSAGVAEIVGNVTYAGARLLQSLPWVNPSTVRFFWQQNQRKRDASAIVSSCSTQIPSQASISVDACSHTTAFPTAHTHRKLHAMVL